MSDAVTEFGRLMGLDDLAAGHHGSACRLQWEDGSSLEVEEVNEELLVSLAFPAPHLRSGEMLQALQLLDQRQPSGAQALQVGLVGVAGDARLVVLARLPSRGARGDQVQQAAERCRQWQRRWESACQRALP